MSKKNKKIEEEFIDVEEDTMDLVPEEQEDYIEEEEKVIDPERKYKRTKRIINIFIIVLVLIICMITVDIVRVAKYEQKPLFAIKTKTYKDGGSEEYTGLGYKVIKYNQLQGRRDIEIGTWSLKYDTKPITLQDIDIAIELNDDEVKTYNKYYKKFVRIITKLKKVDKKNRKITVGYTDEDGKYSVDIVCDLVKEQLNVDKFEEGKEITIIGTIKDYKTKTKKDNRTLYIKNCIAEQ